MIILGIDPGSRVTGFAVIEVNRKTGLIRHLNHGVIVLDVKKKFSERICDLGQGLRQVLTKHQPHQVVIEKIFLGRNADSAFKLGHARGVAMYEALLVKAEVIEYATRSVKKGIVGTGAASKEEVAMALSRLLNMKAINRLDASDALALAVYHAFQSMNSLLLRPSARQDQTL